MQVPHDCMLQIMNKSGVASKRHLITGACVVDEGYTGEIFVNLHNVGTTAQFIEAGQKIAQGVFVRIEKPRLWEVEEDNIYGKETPRFRKTKPGASKKFSAKKHSRNLASFSASGEKSSSSLIYVLCVNRNHACMYHGLALAKTL